MLGCLGVKLIDAECVFTSGNTNLLRFGAKMQRAFLAADGTGALHYVGDVGSDLKCDSAAVARAGMSWRGLLLRISPGFPLQEKCSADEGWLECG